MTIEELKKSTLPTLSCELKRDLIDIYLINSKNLSKKEFNQLCKECLMLLKEHNSQEILLNFDEIFKVILAKKINSYTQMKQNNAYEDVLDYLNSYLGKPFSLNDAKRKFGMFQSYMEDKKYCFYPKEWIKLLNNPVLNQIMALMTDGMKKLIQENKIEKITQNQTMQYLIYTYTALKGIDITLSKDTTYYRNLCANDNYYNELLTIQAQYNLAVNDLIILLNILQKYVKKEDILEILPRVIKIYQSKTYQSSQELIILIMQECFKYIKDKIVKYGVADFNTLIINYNKRKKFLTYELNREPTILEIAQGLNITEENLRNFLQAYMRREKPKYRNLQEWTKIPEKDLYTLINQLPMPNKLALRTLFGPTYSKTNAIPNWESKEQENLCYATIDMLKKQYQEFDTISGLEITYHLDDILGINLAILKLAIEKLDEKSVWVINCMFGADLNGGYDESKLKLPSYKEDYEYALKKLLNIVKYVDLANFLQIPKDILEDLISKLTIEEQEILFLQWHRETLCYRMYEKITLNDLKSLELIYEVLKNGYQPIKRIKEKNHSED